MDQHMQAVYHVSNGPDKKWGHRGALFHTFPYGNVILKIQGKGKAQRGKSETWMCDVLEALLLEFWGFFCVGESWCLHLTSSPGVLRQELSPSAVKNWDSKPGWWGADARVNQYGSTQFTGLSLSVSSQEEALFQSSGMTCLDLELQAGSVNSPQTHHYVMQTLISSADLTAGVLIIETMLSNICSIR